MRVLISGASGLIGTALTPTLKEKNHDIFRLVRKTPLTGDDIQWDAEKGFAESELAKLENFDAVIHLAGDNVAEGSWTAEKKKRIRDSRVIGTRVLIEALKTLQNPPRNFISASAIGFYGNRKDEVLTEDSAKGAGFFPEVCDAWELEAEKAQEFGARVVCMRIGIVLAKEGGALDKMMTPFKFGVGGVVGSGKQWMSWIALDDIIAIIHFFLENPQTSGSYNLTAPNPVTNKEFTKTFGKAISRPTVLPIPEFAVKLVFGEMGETLLLEGARVLPEKLQEADYKFKYTNLQDAIKSALD